MPRVAMDFSRTVVYHFVCKDELIKCSYVGSTTNFVKRKYQHKSACHQDNNKDHNLKLYQTIRDNGGWDNWKMIPLEEYPCENLTQQTMREQVWINKLKPELNCKFAFQTEEGCKQKEKDYNKKYKDTHKEETKEYQKGLNHKEYRDTHKEQNNLNQKKYVETHREQRNEYQRKYRAKLQASQNIPIDLSAKPVLDCQGPEEGSH